MKITKTVDFFIQNERFQQLSCCKRWAVGIVSMLPALTILGIIASPFIWKGMVHAFANKKVKPTKNPSVSAVASKTSVASSKVSTPSSSSSIVFLPDEPLSDDFKNKFTKFIAGKTAEEIAELAIEPPFDFDGIWQDVFGEIVFDKLQFIFSTLSHEQLHTLLKIWFLATNNPTQTLFDACYLTLYDAGKQDLFAEVVVTLESEGRLKDFQSNFSWCWQDTPKVNARNRFLRDMLHLALKEDATMSILNTLIRNDDHTGYELYALDSFEFEKLTSSETQKLKEWLDTLPKYCKIKELIASYLTSNFSEAAERRAIHLFHEAHTKGTLPELLAPLRLKEPPEGFEDNYELIVPYLTNNIIDELFQADPDFFGLNSAKIKSSILNRIFSEELEDDQITHILKHYEVNGNLSPQVVHNYVVANSDYNIRFTRYDLLLNILTKESLISYFQTCNQALHDNDKTFLLHYIEASLRKENYEEGLLLFEEHCSNLHKKLFHKNALGHLLSKGQAEKMKQFITQYKLRQHIP